MSLGLDMDKLYIEVFGFDEKEYSEENIDLLIMQNLMNDNQKGAFQYIMDVCTKANKINNQELITISQKYLTTFVTGGLDAEHKNYFLQWISENYFPYWNQVFENIAENKDVPINKFILEILRNYKKSKEIKYKNIYDIFANKKVREI